ncbi:MAG: L-histidine N(alpha)-methyltransferase [Deltaproteobacteria bacterium]|nr:L-histidine N(alpha)-methyltransferase [Deltaproteobacteria bacterium]
MICNGDAGGNGSNVYGDEGLQHMYSKGGLDSAVFGERAEEILAGLESRRKYIPSKFFYDARGSKLFEEITRLDEYYPSRTEKRIMRDNAPEIVNEFEGATIVEIGSGDCSKISILLDAMSPEARHSIVYVPVDVSPSAIQESRCRLRDSFGVVQVDELVADFTGNIDALSKYHNKILCFFGSTIGNLDREQSIGFVRKIGKLMECGERFLLGLDMVKEREVLERAYNDNKGVTAEFNRNILKVANRIAGTDFIPDMFEHVAFYNRKANRIEMYLEARGTTEVHTPLLKQELLIKEGERIHTENSHKFTLEHVSLFAEAGHLDVERVFNDSRHWFSIVEYVK